MASPRELHRERVVDQSLYSTPKDADPKVADVSLVFAKLIETDKLLARNQAYWQDQEKKARDKDDRKKEEDAFGMATIYGNILNSYRSLVDSAKKAEYEKQLSELAKKQNVLRFLLEASIKFKEATLSRW